jgi:hypothetical protein
LVHLTHLIITAFSFHTFPHLGRKRKWWPYWNQLRTTNSPKIYVRLAYCPRRANFLKKLF